MWSLYLVSVSLHILSAIIWIGGITFLAFVLVPVTREKVYRHISADLIEKTGIRFRLIGWICLILLIISGTANLFYRGIGWNELTSLHFWEGPFGYTLGIKLILVTVILILSIFHDFVIGPKATKLWREDAQSPQSRRWRRRASWFGRINLLLALIVLFLAVIMIRGGI